MLFRQSLEHTVGNLPRVAFMVDEGKGALNRSDLVPIRGSVLFLQV